MEILIWSNFNLFYYVTRVTYILEYCINFFWVYRIPYYSFDQSMDKYKLNQTLEVCLYLTWGIWSEKY